MAHLSKQSVPQGDSGVSAREELTTHPLFLFP